MMWLVLATLAHAADAGPDRWSGLAPERLAELQRDLLAPSPPVRGPTAPGQHEGALHYALQGGGKVILHIAPGPTQAADIFDGLVRTAAQHWPPAAVPIPAERSQGDGEGIALVQFDNVVILVRDPRGQAASVVQQLRASLLPAPTER